ncbi:unnamed protein product [Calypogeia fissa]
MGGGLRCPAGSALPGAKQSAHRQGWKGKLKPNQREDERRQIRAGGQNQGGWTQSQEASTINFRGEVGTIQSRKWRALQSKGAITNKVGEGRARSKSRGASWGEALCNLE